MPIIHVVEVLSHRFRRVHGLGFVFVASRTRRIFHSHRNLRIFHRVHPRLNLLRGRRQGLLEPGELGELAHSDRPFPSRALEWVVHEPCCDHHDLPPAAPKRPFAGIMRYLSWCAVFSLIYSMGAVCPFCGRQGCPTGTASAGVVGLVFASLMQWLRSFRSVLSRRHH